MLKTIIKSLLFLFASIALLVVLAVLKIAFYEQHDDPVLMQGKRDYLQEIVEAGVPAELEPPNIVFVLYDDMGYGDLGITGSRAIATPNIDQLAREGVLLNQFYAPSPICTPSRYGFLTGRHAERGELSHVVFPPRHPITLIQRLFGANTRMPAHEITLAEVLKAAGYRTGMVGKWHLGDYSPSLPNDLGFEEFFGALYSNDMQPFALYRNNEIVHEAPSDQTKMSARYVREVSAFIEGHSGEPFFLYLAHHFPHIPLYVEESRLGKSKAGLYGDVVEELDEGIGQLVESLKQAGVYENTLIIITSDNGPWFEGSPGPVRGRKGETFEGGMHVPFIAHWPAGLGSGEERNGLAMGTDLLPTVLEILALPAPEDRLLDGKSLLPMLMRGEESPHEYLYYFSGDLLGVRDQRFKYMPRRPIVYSSATARFGIGFPQGPWLFDLDIDPDESYNVSDHRPEDFQRLKRVYEKKAGEMEANRLGREE